MSRGTLIAGAAAMVVVAACASPAPTLDLDLAEKFASGTTVVAAIPTTTLALPTGAIPLTFAWNPPCSVPVSEIVNRGASDVELTYQVELQAILGGTVVRRTGVRADIPSDPTTTDADRKVLSALYSSPDITVDEAGQVIEVGDTDSVVDALLAADGDGAFADFPRERLTSIVTDWSTSETWGSWVSDWTEVGYVEATSDDTSTVLVPLYDDVTGELQVRTSFLNAKPTEDIASAVATDLFGEAPAPIDVVDARIEYAAEIDGNARTMRTTRSLYTQSLTATVNGDTRTMTLRREATLRWDEAVGCT